MAAAESDRDSPSTLSAEFLNFSAKDISAVSVSPGYPASQLLAVLSQRRYDALSCFWLGMFLLAQLSSATMLTEKLNALLGLKDLFVIPRSCVPVRDSVTAAG